MSERVKLTSPAGTAVGMVKPKAGGIGGSDAMGGNPTDSVLDFVIAVREGFKNPISMESKDSREQVFIWRILEKKQGNAEMHGPAGRHQQQQSQQNGTIVRPSATISFEDGSVLLTQESHEIIASAADDHASIREGPTLTHRPQRAEVQGVDSGVPVSGLPHRRDAERWARAAMVRVGL